MHFAMSKSVIVVAVWQYQSIMVILTSIISTKHSREHITNHGLPGSQKNDNSDKINDDKCSIHRKSRNKLTIPFFKLEHHNVRMAR